MEPKAHVICIGNEIMLGHIKNTNAQYISKNLSSIGIESVRHIDIPDEPQTIISSIKSSLNDSRIVVVTGGLGPTVDDLTLECIARALNKKLVLQKRVLNHVIAHFKKRKIKMPRNNIRQALIPENAIPILNNIGTAPGLIIPIDEKILIALPGVPFELYPMFEGAVIPYLKKVWRGLKIIKSRIIRITGLPESKVNEKIEDILKEKSVQMGIYPHPEEITVKITAEGPSQKIVDSKIREVEQKIKRRLGDFIFGYDEANLEEIVGNLLKKSKKTLVTAESCTGGLLGDRITNIPGSSRYYLGGVVAYSDELKIKLLNIPKETIKKYGAVSREVASLMAKNIRASFESDIGIGISGIAGPSGATKKKPLGFVYIAISTKKKTHSKEFRFLGQRNIIKYNATQAALNMIRGLFHGNTSSLHSH